MDINKSDIKGGKNSTLCFLKKIQRLLFNYQSSKLYSLLIYIIKIVALVNIFLSELYSLFFFIYNKISEQICSEKQLYNLFNYNFAMVSELCFGTVKEESKLLYP